ncbi:MAG: hypothetical protein ABSG75_11035 [Syntrophales bacterium]|jgi:hypothetical protein
MPVLTANLHVIDISDLGIVSHFGYRVGAINIKFQIGEGNPQDITGYYEPNQRRQVIAALNRWHLRKMEEEDDR